MISFQIFNFRRYPIKFPADSKRWSSSWITFTLLAMVSWMVSNFLSASVAAFLAVSSVVSHKRLELFFALFDRFDLGIVQPGLICSKVWRHPLSFSTIDSTVAVQTKGFGSWFQTATYSSMASIKSSTLTNTPRRTRFPVNSPNQRSTRLSQLELVGMKWGRNRGCRFNHDWTRGCECVP